MKKFLKKISYTVLPVWLFFVGMVIYLWSMDESAGDLMRLGLIEAGPEYNDSIAAQLLPRVYYTGESDDSVLRANPADVVVIGDSFSHGGGGLGKEGDYVNYVAHDSGRRVVVFTPQDPSLSSPMQVAYDLIVHGGFDSTNIRNLVVEEAERYLVPRHSGFTTKNKPLRRPTAEVELNTSTDERKESSPLLRVKDYIFYHVFGYNPICEARLSRPMFGGPEPYKLYFFNEDLLYGMGCDSLAQRRVVNCFDQVIAAARERGINLVIVIACDKYDMYQDYIVDNPYPRKTLNEDIERWMAQDSDRIVYSKRIHMPLLEQGVRDVYMFNDTHWSPASARLVAAQVISRLK